MRLWVLLQYGLCAQSAPALRPPRQLVGGPVAMGAPLARVHSASIQVAVDRTHLRKVAGAQNALGRDLNVSAISEKLRLNRGSRELREHPPHDIHLLGEPAAVGG